MTVLTQPVSNSYTAQLRQRGQLTIPRRIRDDLSLAQGDVLSVVQIGEVIVLSPIQPKTPALAKQFSALMDEAGVTLADLLAGLAEERELLWQERQSDGA